MKIALPSGTSGSSSPKMSNDSGALRGDPPDGEETNCGVWATDVPPDHAVAAGGAAATAAATGVTCVGICHCATVGAGPPNCTGSGTPAAAGNDANCQAVESLEVGATGATPDGPWGAALPGRLAAASGN